MSLSTSKNMAVDWTLNRTNHRPLEWIFTPKGLLPASGNTAKTEEKREFPSKRGFADPKKDVILRPFDFGRDL